MSDKTSSTHKKAVIFDMDGVLINNHSYHVKAWEEFCKRHNKKLSEAEFEQHVNGRPSKDTIAYLFSNNTPAKEVQQLSEEKESIYRDIYQPHLKATSGLHTFIDSLQQAEWLLAVATSSPKVNLRFILEGLGISHYFPTTVDSSGVKKGKPAPDLYLKAAEILDIAPRRCIVFEDSKAGITAAKKAGMAVIGISSTHSREELEQTNLRCIFDSFDTIDLNLLDRILHEVD